jgi:hypothetical protein
VAPAVVDANTSSPAASLIFISEGSPFLDDVPGDAVQRRKAQVRDSRGVSMIGLGRILNAQRREWARVIAQPALEHSEVKVPQNFREIAGKSSSAKQFETKCDGARGTKSEV